MLLLAVSFLLLSRSHGFLSTRSSVSLTFRSQQPAVFSAPLFATASSSDPITFTSGASTRSDLVQALEEAVALAVSSLPKNATSIDLGIVHVSSLYDGGIHPIATSVIPTILAALKPNYQIKHIIGSSVAGCIASTPVIPTTGTTAAAATITSISQATDYEGVPAVSITLGVIPDCEITSFHVQDLPDDPDGRLSRDEWKRMAGLKAVPTSNDDVADDAPTFFLLPHPAFSTELDSFLMDLSQYFPGCSTVGGIASTVSSLSRAKLFCWSRNQEDTSTFTDGCVGIAMRGDVRVMQMTALGAKPVGGIYQIVKGEDATIYAIVLDETATEALEQEQDENEEEDEDEEEEDENEKTMTDKERLIASYAKARIPKPPLAEANFVMRTLCDDDQAFMRRVLLIGLDQGGVGRTASELLRLAQGEGHRFTVTRVARGGMKDGSVTFPLGSVNVQAGTRVRFFVREANFARKEIKALWTGYKKRVLNEQFQKQSDPAASDLFEPAACFVIPTLDRGNKFFGGKPGYESSTVARSLPGVTCVSGFYANGVIGRIDKAETIKVGVQGSASSYLLIGSKSKRPIYSPATAAAEEAAESDQRAAQEVESLRLTAEEEKRQSQLKVPSVGESKAAPRYENGELMWKRREVHAGRALTVSTVEWSVAEKMAKPSSVLEGYMWDKETEVDRFRERVPLANLVSQCRLSANDPTAPKPRNWIQPVNDHIATKGFVIIPEMKRVEPTTGSLRKKYDLVKLSKLFVKAEAPVVSVNCDQVLFGGALEDITTVRQATSAAAIEQASEDGVVVPPILASDLLLYPYQLYKQRLAGADAVNLVVGSLEKKDLIYLTKIAASLQLQTLVTVTSEVQIRSLSVIPDGTIVGVIVSNRELEDFSFDMTGEQAIRLLKSEALKEFLEARGNNIPVLVEGRVGIIERLDENGDPNTNAYLKELKDAGAKGVIVGGGLAVEGSDTTKKLQTLQEAIYR